MQGIQIKKILVPFALLAGLVVISLFGMNGASNPKGEAAKAELVMTDFEAAKSKAESEGKAILLYFTGSDWCPPCMALKKDVFTQEAFESYVNEEAVFVELDFPKRKQLSEEQMEQNHRLAYRYGVISSEGMLRVPSVVLIEPDGELLGKTGYLPMKAAEYVEHLRELAGG